MDGRFFPFRAANTEMYIKGCIFRGEILKVADSMCRRQLMKDGSSEERRKRI